MKRKAGRPNKPSTNEDTNTVVCEMPANCSLCLSDENQVYDCQQFLFDDLQQAFDFSLNVTDKKRFKICVTCSYHINILAKFINNNICLSGGTPICFMCKNSTVFDIKPYDLKIQLKDTPLGKQTEEKGNYYACVVCLYQLIKYQKYKDLTNNFGNGPSTPNETPVKTPAKSHIKTPIKIATPEITSATTITKTATPTKGSVNSKNITADSSVSSTVSSPKTKSGPTVLLHKLDVKKFKLAPFVLINLSDISSVGVNLSKIGQKRNRKDSSYTEVLPKKRRYDPSPSPPPSTHSDDDDEAKNVFESRGSGKKTGKRVTINTRPSVMKLPSRTNKTPMKSALKSPHKSPVKVKPPPKLQIKFPPRAAKSPKIEKSSKVDKSPNAENSSTKVTSIKNEPEKEPAHTRKATKSPTVDLPVPKPTGRPSRTPTKQSPRKQTKIETSKSPTDVDVAEDDDLDDSIPETPANKSGRKKRGAPKKLAMKTPAEKKQMVVHISDGEANNGSDGEDAPILENKAAEEAEENSLQKITDLIDDHGDDDQAEVIISEDTDNMDKMVVDDNSQNSGQNDGKKDVVVAEKEGDDTTEANKSVENADDTIESNKSANSLEDVGSKTTVPAGMEDAAAEIDEFLKSTLAHETQSKSENPADLSTSHTKAAGATTTTTNNGNSNSDKENLTDLLREDTNSSDFGVIKKLNNNERIEMGINMDKIFDELRTEATP